MLALQDVSFFWSWKPKILWALLVRNWLWFTGDQENISRHQSPSSISKTTLKSNFSTSEFSKKQIRSTINAFESLILCVNISGTVKSLPRRNTLPYWQNKSGCKDYHWNTTLIRHSSFLMISSLFMRWLLRKGMTCFSLFSKSVIRHFLKNPSGGGVDGLLPIKSVTREEKHFRSFSLPGKILTGGTGSWGWWADEKKFTDSCS